MGHNSSLENIKKCPFCQTFAYPIELLPSVKSKYFISGEINTEIKDGQAKIAELKEKYSDGKIDELDGLSVEYNRDWRFNVRPSNTEPLLRLNLEAKSKELMEEKRDEAVALIRA